MQFQVSPFVLPGKVALFCPRFDDVWRKQAVRCEEEAFLQREVASVMSTDSGHFLLVLQGDELATIRDVCRIENCEFVGVFDRSDISSAITERLSHTQLPANRKSLFC
ncbi:hypothetical protein SH661x_000575 [Planctomicrobium sp. SH661]|uniref:hypothetical protein n=1 Tax=Planctomicrobium sp. SH661 TaxID=3448124 RepID=UPI003F5C3E65